MAGGRSASDGSTTDRRPGNNHLLLTRWAAAAISVCVEPEIPVARHRVVAIADPGARVARAAGSPGLIFQFGAAETRVQRIASKVALAHDGVETVALPGTREASTTRFFGLAEQVCAPTAGVIRIVAEIACAHEVVGPVTSPRSRVAGAAQGPEGLRQLGATTTGVQQDSAEVADALRRREVVRARPGPAVAGATRRGWGATARQGRAPAARVLLVNQVFVDLAVAVVVSSVAGLLRTGVPVRVGVVAVDVEALRAFAVTVLVLVEAADAKSRLGNALVVSAAVGCLDRVADPPVRAAGRAAASARANGVSAQDDAAITRTAARPVDLARLTQPRRHADGHCREPADAIDAAPTVAAVVGGLAGNGTPRHAVRLGQALGRTALVVFGAHRAGRDAHRRLGGVGPAVLGRVRIQVRRHVGGVRPGVRSVDVDVIGDGAASVVEGGVPVGDIPSLVGRVH